MPIKEFIVTTFISIYFDSSYAVDYVADLLLDLLRGCDLLETTCLEQILLEICKQHNLDKVIKHLWTVWSTLLKD